jgi:CheY-like chemotaxis protein
MTRPIRVLLIEDNPGDAELTKETLEAGKVHVEISIAIDGVEALARLRARTGAGGSELPDLILLDLNLPKLDGRQILTELKQDELLRRIPVVILTSSDAESDVVRSYELGASCYVTKPVGLESFQAIVRSVEDFWFSVVRLPSDRTRTL